MVKESTKLTIYGKSPFKNDFANVIKFKNNEEKNEFFNNNEKWLEKIYETDDFQQLANNGAIRVSGRVEKYELATYMRFKNPYNRNEVEGNFWYYAFINDVKYISENTTELHYEIDVWNTFEQILAQFEYSATVVQNTRPNTIESVINHSQGFASGTKQGIVIEPIGETIDFLVIVAKPTFQFKGAEKSTANLANTSIAGTFKNFKYFFIPIDSKTGNSLAFSLNGKSYPSYGLLKLFRDLFGFEVSSETKSEDNLAVNNIVNMYITKSIGLEYIVRGEDSYRRVEFINNQNMLGHEVVEIGETTTTTTIINNNSDFTVGDEGDKSTIDGRIEAFTRAIKKIIPEAKPEGIAGIIGNFWHESELKAERYEADWATGNQYDRVKEKPTMENIGKSFGDWQAMHPTMTLNQSGYRVGNEHWIGIGLGMWTGVRSKALYDFAKEHKSDLWAFETQLRFMMTESKSSIVAQVANLTDLEKATRIFQEKWEGVAGNATIQRLEFAKQALSKVQGAIINDIVSNTVENSVPAPSPQRGAPNVEKAMNFLRSYNGKYLGWKVEGNNQCYAVAGYYSRDLGGANVWFEFGERKPLLPTPHNGRGAHTMHVDYDWASLGWGVINEPSVEEIRQYIGAIYIVRANSGFPLFTEWAGHVGVLEGVNGDTLSVIEQNAPTGDPVEINQYNIHQLKKNITALIIPPELLGNKPLANGGSQRYSTTTTKTVDYCLIFALNFPTFSPQVFTIENLNLKAKERIKQILKNKTGNDEDFEHQLLTSEFVDFELFDYYGGSYIFQPQFFKRSLNENDKQKVIISGGLGDNNQSHITFSSYNVKHVTGGEIEQGESKGAGIKQRDLYKYGYTDTSARNLTILNDYTASYFQSNKHSHENQQTMFKEQREMINRQAQYKNQEVEMLNHHATYASEYALETAKINGVGAGVDFIGSIFNGFGQGGLLGAIGGGMKSAFGSVNTFRDIGRAEVENTFTNEKNMMRTQAQALSNMQAKLSLDQSIRSYNAKLSDMENQPVSIQQVGSDLSWQYGNQLSEIYYRVSTVQDDILVRANNYIKQYGVLVSETVPKLWEYSINRKRFNYVKILNGNFSNLMIPSFYLNSFIAMLQSGVRIWEYSEIKDDKKVFDMTKPNETLVEKL